MIFTRTNNDNSPMIITGVFHCYGPVRRQLNRALDLCKLKLMVYEILDGCRWCFVLLCVRETKISSVLIAFAIPTPDPDDTAYPLPDDMACRRLMSQPSRLSVASPAPDNTADRRPTYRFTRPDDTAHRRPPTTPLPDARRRGLALSEYHTVEPV
jgi:hypothetical protein